MACKGSDWNGTRLGAPPGELRARLAPRGRERTAFSAASAPAAEAGERAIGAASRSDAAGYGAPWHGAPAAAVSATPAASATATPAAIAPTPATAAARPRRTAAAAPLPPSRLPREPGEKITALAAPQIGERRPAAGRQAALPRMPWLSGFEPLPVSAGRFELNLRCSPWKYESIPCGLRLASSQICSAETVKHL